MKKKLFLGCFIIILSVILVLSLFACDKGEEEETEKHPLKIAVLSDIHLMTEKEVGNPESKGFQTYAVTTNVLLHLSEAIYKSAVDNLIEEKPDVVLMSGDLSETGSKSSMQVVVDGCKKLEEAGIKVFVTGGISDFSQVIQPAVTVETFPQMFNDYGYGEAIARDTETLSYLADMDETHRLLVIDTASLYDYSITNTVLGVDRTPKVSDSLLEFVESALENGRDNGKETLVMSYFPINNSIGDYFGTMTKRYLIAIDRQEEFEDLLTFYGAQYIVSGHMHAQNFLTISNQYCDLYDYTASALSGYPLEIRYMTAQDSKYGTADRFLVEDKTISEIKREYLPAKLSDEDKEAFVNDPVAYAKEYTKENMWRYAQNRIDDSTKKNWLFLRILYKLGFYTGEEIYDEPLAVQFGDDIYQMYLDLINMPLYGEDSIESVCNEYDIELPKINYTTVKDFIAESLCDIYSDDIHITSGSDEAIVFRYIIYTGLRMLARYDLGSVLHEMNSLVKEFDLNGVADKIFTDGEVDVLLDNAGIEFLSVAEPILQQKTNGRITVLNLTDGEQLLEWIETLMPYALALSKEYDEEKDTIFGIDYHKYFDFENGLFHIEKFLDEALIDIFAGDLLY